MFPFMQSRLSAAHSAAHSALLCAALLALPALPVQAHEFWIDPVAPQIATDTPLVADIRVGEMFKGGAYSYLEPNFQRFEIVMGDIVTPVTGRAGDSPALNMAPPGKGLAIVVHVTRTYRLTYDSLEKFASFVAHKDADWVMQAHAERGLPDTGFAERYVRYAKSLIAVGDGAGADRDTGLEIEIVAGANPYTDDLSAGMPVQVLYQGALRADAQIELFARQKDGEVSVTLHRTDADGRAVLPVAPGSDYLVDSVVLRPLDPSADTDPVWESLWASLTFTVPQ